MHPEAMDWCRRWGDDQTGIALDVGGRDVNGTAHWLWPNMSWTVLDPAGGRMLDRPPSDADRVIRADARYWVPDQSYDVVLCTEVFEHLPHWSACVQVMRDAVAADGLIVITCGGPGRGPHSDIGTTLRPGEYYGNVEPSELQAQLTRFGLVSTINVLGADLRAVAAFRPHIRKGGRVGTSLTLT